MLRPLVLGPGLIFDGRSVMLSLCALFFGPWAVLTACLMTIGVRLTLGGTGMVMGVLVILSSSAIGLWAHYRFRPALEPPSMGRLYSMGLVVHLAMLGLMFTLPEGAGLATIKRLGLPVILLYPLATILAGKILADRLSNVQARQALDEIAESYRLLFDASLDAILLTSPEGRIFNANPAAGRIFGRSEEEILKIGRDGIIDPAESRLAAALDERARTGQFTGELNFIRKDGTVFPADVSTSLFHDADGNIRTSMVIRDITERKRAEEALQTSYRFLQMAYAQKDMPSLLAQSVREIKSCSESLAVGIRLLDERGNIPYEAYVGFNRHFYETESPLSVHSDACMCINVISGDTDPARAFYTPGGSFYMNATSRFLATVSDEEKGKTRNVCNQAGYESVALIPIRLKDSILGLIHVADPSEDKVPLNKVELLEKIGIQLGTAIMRIRLKDELRESEVHFRTLADSGTALIWTSGLDKKCTYFNRPWLDFTGRALTQELGDGWVDGVHPDDRGHCWNVYAAAFDRREKFSMDYRLMHRDGQYRWIQDDGAPRYNSRGEFIGYIGYCLDITRRKNVETALSRSESRLRRFYESGMMGVIYWNEDGTITEANDKFLDMLGYRREDLAADRINGYRLTPEAFRDVDEAAVRELKTTGVNQFPYEKEYIRKDGQPLPVMIAGAVLDAQNFSGVAFVLDMTERKQAEQRIRQMNEDLERRVDERTAELKKTIATLEELNRVFVGRELKMAELKEKIAELEMRGA